MHIRTIDKDWAIKLRLSIYESCFVMNLSKATIYRRQKIDGFPKIYKDLGRSYLQTKDVIAWTSSRGMSHDN